MAGQRNWDEISTDLSSLNDVDEEVDVVTEGVHWSQLPEYVNSQIRSPPKRKKKASTKSPTSGATSLKVPKSKSPGKTKPGTRSSPSKPPKSSPSNTSPSVHSKPHTKSRNKRRVDQSASAPKKRPKRDAPANTQPPPETESVQYAATKAQEEQEVDGAMEESHYLYARELARKIRADSDSVYFHEGVDVSAVSDYLRVVKDPIDMLKIHWKLVNKAYSDYEQFSQDFIRMFDNCALYASKGKLFRRDYVVLKRNALRLKEVFVSYETRLRQTGKLPILPTTPPPEHPVTSPAKHIKPSELREGDFVLVKVNRAPWWPAKIVNISELSDKAPKAKQKDWTPQLARFLTKKPTYAWVLAAREVRPLQLSDARDTFDTLASHPELKESYREAILQLK